MSQRYDGVCCASVVAYCTLRPLHVWRRWARLFGAGAGPSCGGPSALAGASGAVGKEVLNGDSPLKLLRLRKKLKCRRRAWTTGELLAFLDRRISFFVARFRSRAKRAMRKPAPGSPAHTKIKPFPLRGRCNRGWLAWLALDRMLMAKRGK